MQIKYNLLFFTILTILFSCQKKTDIFFSEIKSNESNIHFSKNIKEDSIYNVINYEYLYNGGGVAIGDFNNDSLPDIYFTGNMVSNKMYINKGNFTFEDITDLAGVTGNSKWCKGATVIDINNDGMLDIYVSVSLKKASKIKTNLLYVCQRIDPVLKLPLYKEMAAEYGLADTSETQMANFFDYDNDGDLDVYLLENEATELNPNNFRPLKNDGTQKNTDKLLQNNFDKTLQHAVYTNVSAQAGIRYEGYGLGVSVCDINQDGWKDIYVSNDYISNNVLYINNKNGTFTNKCELYFKHTSRNAMGNDVADINNDGLPDVVELDMAPADNYRLKMMNNNVNYATYQNSATYNYMHQYVRNTLQINKGPRLLSNDSIGDPLFSEVAYFSGVAQTDWSWAPLLVDADNDGWRDLMISNGLPKDMTDMDFMAYRDEAKNKTPLKDVLNQLPSAKINNYIFKNNKDETFTNKTTDWGWNIPTFSAGMAYADFDRDGDIDVIINNTNMEATLLQNNSNSNKKDSANYLQIQLQGDSANINGIGATIALHYKGQTQVYENNPYRGYLSSMENMAHFGVGKHTIIDTIIIYWNNTQLQTLTNVNANQRLVIKKNITAVYEYIDKDLAPKNLFTDITNTSGINYYHNESDFIDFTIQRLMPHKLSQYGPALAASDINGDGIDDLIIGGSSPNNATTFMQQNNGKFIQKTLPTSSNNKLADDAGICIFDADGDSDNDIYIASGGAENSPNSSAYTDKFYRNDGKGNFIIDSIAIPKNNSSKSCVKAADYDNDGDVDLFIGGRVLPGSYPLPVSSFIYKNDGKGNFSDVTSMIAASLINIGMVCDAVWSDADNDGDVDLLIAGEWMAPTILKNEKGIFIPTSNSLSNLKGWYNSITPADLDNDGDIDYVMGNYGSNGFYQPSSKFPVAVYAKDFDKNESFDAVYSTWLPSAENGLIQEYPVAGRDELIKEMTFMKGKFGSYAAYANTQMKDIFSKAELENSYQNNITNSKTGWIENKGNLPTGQVGFEFVWHNLPLETQYSPIFGITINDFNNDGNMDIALTGNDYGMAPILGRNDAFNGLILAGNGKGDFKPLSILESGLFIPNDGKALVQFVSNNTLNIAASQNQGQLKIFEKKQQADSIIKILPNELYATITFRNGQKRKEEFYYGSSFYSQSSRFVLVNNTISSIEIINNRKEKRTFTFK
jgi:enediyne biosynthesis protein E4